jgi:tRNA1Val (adenine37-N6)-methyltransferase
MLQKKEKTTSKPFTFKQFIIEQDQCTMKIGTDAVLLGAWADVQNATSILDIGAGTGIIAIMSAQRNAEARVVAVEIEASACQQARENMASTHWSSRLSVVQSSIQEYAQEATHGFDAIISNPPFFTGGTFSHNQDRNNVRHTIKLPNGDLLLAARKLLNPNGKFSVILPYIEGLRFVEMAKNYHLFCTRITEVMPKPDKGVERLLLEFGHIEKPIVKDILVLKQENEFSEEYVQLAGAFYLSMQN